jgi:hypothetical protein
MALGSNGGSGRQTHGRRPAHEAPRQNFSTPPLPGPGCGVQVQSAQHNLPANGKRQLLHTVHVPDPSAPGAAFVSGLPIELAPMELQSVSPSGGLGARGIGRGGGWVREAGARGAVASPPAVWSQGSAASASGRAPPQAALTPRCPATPPRAGRRSLVARSHEGGVLLELWDANRLVKELLVRLTRGSLWRRRGGGVRLTS